MGIEWKIHSAQQCSPTAQSRVLQFAKQDSVKICLNSKHLTFEPKQMSLRMIKPTICIMRKQRTRSAVQISAFVFATLIVQFLFYLYPKFQASTFILWLFSLVCGGPGLKTKLYVFSCTGSNIFAPRTLTLSTPGPSCSKLTTSLVNISLKFQTLILQVHCYFLLKKCENPLHCKGFSHFFNKK